LVEAINGYPLVLEEVEVVEHHVKVMVEDNMVTMANIMNNKKVHPMEVEEETLKQQGVSIRQWLTCTPNYLLVCYKKCIPFRDLSQ